MVSYTEVNMEQAKVVCPLCVAGQVSIVGRPWLKNPPAGWGHPFPCRWMICECGWDERVGPSAGWTEAYRPPCVEKPSRWS